MLTSLKHIMRNVSRFCSRANTCAVESSMWRGGNHDHHDRQTFPGSVEEQLMRLISG